MERVDVEALHAMPDCARSAGDATAASGPSGLQERCSISLNEVAGWLRLDPQGDPPVVDVHFPVRSIRPGATLCRQGEPFHWVHALVGGRVKSVVVDRRGTEQIVSLGFAGEVVGFDGTAGTCPATMVALTHGLVARLPHEQLVEIGRHYPLARQLLDRASAAEVARHVRTVRLLAIAKAPSRLAAFLLGLAHCELGNVAHAATVDLAMTRGELGNYLGLRFETVIRGFATLEREGLVRLRRRSVDLVDPAGLDALAAGIGTHARRRTMPEVPHANDRPARRAASPAPGQPGPAGDRRATCGRGNAGHAAMPDVDRPATGGIR